jgi:hypothetical protein
LYIKARQTGVATDDIFFKYGKPFSPYMELSFENMNEHEVLREVEINPFYRLFDIFKNLFDPNFIEDETVIEILHDIMIHHISDIDILMGLNKKDYYIYFIIEDMKAGLFGKYIRDNVKTFNPEELRIIANNILNLYMTGENVYLLKETIKCIFKNVYIFTNSTEKDEVIFFMRTPKTDENLEKLEIIKYIFLPFKYDVDVYWEQFFGVIGVENLMAIDTFLIY